VHRLCQDWGASLLRATSVIAELQARPHKCHLMPGGVSHLEVFSTSQNEPGTCDYWDLEVFRNVKSRGSGSPSVLTFASIFVPGGKGVYILRYLITGWWLKRKLLSRSKFIMVRDHKLGSQPHKSTNPWPN
jgi:hypothetical protein